MTDAGSEMRLQFLPRGRNPNGTLVNVIKTF